MITIFDGQDEDASSAAFDWFGGPGTLEVTGDLGGGTFTLELSTDGGTTWTAVGTMTTKTDVTHPAGFTLMGPCKLRGNLSGATSPNLTASVLGITSG